MVNKRSGQVAYAVMSFGGFLGIGDSYHPLPWNVLTYDTGLGGYVVDLSREQLQGGPSYSASEMPNWSDQTYTNRINQYLRITVQYLSSTTCRLACGVQERKPLMCATL